MSSKACHNPNKIVFIVGPTATGKTDLAVKIAKKINAEIISADSMQVYRSMDIGTAKPGAGLLKKVQHHLIDIKSPSQEFSVYEFRKAALKKIKSIRKKNKSVLVVGGSGLYIRLLIHGITPLGGEDKALRAKLEKRAGSTEGLKKLYEELKVLNSDKASKLKPTDKRRIIRALEVETHKEQKNSASSVDSLSDLGFQWQVIGLRRNRNDLYEAINQRVDRMFKRGLLREVQGLATKRLSKTARQAVGYKELFDSLAKKSEGPSLQTARELIKRNSRRYAKRQMTWFKKEPGIEWVNLDDFSQPVELERYVLGLILRP